jgi:type IV pilus assembly protein PilE
MQRRSGFTLIELMVTVAVIAILAAVAIPSYTNYVVRGKIQEATTNLLDMRVKMEQTFLDNRAYNPGGVVAPNCPIAPSAGLKYFTISCDPLTATTYTVKATGVGNDLSGLVMTIDEGNRRKTTNVPAGWGTPASSGNCWVSKKSGEC